MKPKSGGLYLHSASEPFNEDGFNSGSGAGSIKVDDTVVALKVFRDSLFIFCVLNELF